LCARLAAFVPETRRVTRITTRQTMFFGARIVVSEGLELSVTGQKEPVGGSQAQSLDWQLEW